MSFEDILARSTAAPARIINRLPGMGSLAVGAPADIALLGVEEGRFKLVDAQWNEVNVERRIVSRLTICRGKRMTV
jgi:dihydroorotase